MRLHRLLALLLLSGCAPLGASYNTQNADEDAPSLKQIPTLASHYGVILESKLSVCKPTRRGANKCESSKRTTVAATIRGLATISQSGGEVKMSLSLCRVEALWGEKPYRDVDYLNSPTTLQELGQVAELRGQFLSDSEGPVLESNLSALLLGARLDDPVGEDMPVDEDDAHVFDHDDDGKPGITIDASAIGNVFLGTRVIFALPLRPASDASGNLVGSLEVMNLDLSVFGDSIPFVNAKTKLDRSLQSILVSSQDHQVTMIPGYENCQQVLAGL